MKKTILSLLLFSQLSYGAQQSPFIFLDSIKKFNFNGSSLSITAFTNNHELELINNKNIKEVLLIPNLTEEDKITIIALLNRNDEIIKDRKKLMNYTTSIINLQFVETEQQSEFSADNKKVLESLTDKIKKTDEIITDNFNKIKDILLNAEKSQKLESEE